MKKILIFSLAYYPHVGGAEVAIREVTDRIRDIEFHMVTMRFSSADAREEKIGNVFVHRIGNGSGRLSKYFFQFSAACKVSQLHRKYHFGGIWAMMAHSAGIPAALFKIFHPSVPYLLVLQEGDPPEYIERLAWPVWPLFSRAFTSADAVVAESTFLGRWARRRGFRGPLEVIPNGVNVKHFTGAPVEHDGTILITVSRLVRKNAVDTVIEALSSLPMSVCFRILGTGPEESALKKLSEARGVQNRVEFFGYIDHGNIPAYLHAADIFVRPSRSEGMGNSFIEAMAAGLPVIATQEGGIADFLYDAKRNPDKETTGWAVDKDSPEQIAGAVKDILAHPEQVARVTATAKKMVSEKYDWNLIAERMRSLLGRVIG